MLRRRYAAAAGVLTGVVLVVGACSHSPSDQVHANAAGAGGAFPEASRTGTAGASAAHAGLLAGAAPGGGFGASLNSVATATRASVRLPIGGGFQIRTAQITVAINGSTNVAGKA